MPAKNWAALIPPSIYIAYFVLDLYHVLNVDITSYQYYLFYIFSVLWGGYNLCCVIYTLHFALMTWMSHKFTKYNGERIPLVQDQLEKVELDYLKGILQHSRGYWIALVFISCLGLMVDISYYKLETNAPKNGRALMLTLDIVLVLVNTLMYNLSLLTHLNK